MHGWIRASDTLANRHENRNGAVGFVPVAMTRPFRAANLWPPTSTSAAPTIRPLPRSSAAPLRSN